MLNSIDIDRNEQWDSVFMNKIIEKMTFSVSILMVGACFRD